MEKNNKFLIAGIGEILWDLLPSGKVLGGAPSNFTFHCNSLGNKTAIISAIGKDELGVDIIYNLIENGLNTEFIQKTNEYPTSTVGVSVYEKGIPDYNIFENVAWDYLEYNDSLDELAKQCDAVCFGSLAQRSAVSKNTIQKFLKNTRPDGLKIFDMNLRQDFYDEETIDKSLVFCNVLKLNEEELNVLSQIYGYGSRVYEYEILKKIKQKFDLRFVALTKGADGSLMMSDRESVFLTPENVKVVDTVGAGDAFTAGMAHGILHGFTLAKTNTFANKLASIICSTNGATSPGIELLKQN